MLVFALNWLSFRWEILVMLLSQFPLMLHQTQKGMPHLIASIRAVHLRDAPWVDIFELGASAAGGESFKFCIYISL